MSVQLQVDPQRIASSDGRPEPPPSGRTILMCPPDHFGLHYSINPWMRLDSLPDGALARRQWDTLAAAFRHAGYRIEVITPQPGLPDMVFVDAGIVCCGRYIPSNFAFPQRQGERRHFVDWFVQRGFQVEEVNPRYTFEGHGDTVWAGKMLFCGYGFRSARAAHECIQEILPDVDVVSLELVDPRYYHLDTCFCALDARRALYFPAAFSAAATSALAERLELLEVSAQDAARFACNAVVLGHDVFLPSGTDETSRMLQRHGFRAHQVDVSEFIKAGGACKCLAMQL